MGTYTKTLTENSGGDSYAPSTWTFTVNTTADDIVANSTRIIIPTATVSMKYSPVSGKNSVSYRILSELMCHIGTDIPLTAVQVDWNTGAYSSTTPLNYPVVMLNANTNTSVAMPECNISTSRFFRKSNATQRTVNVDYRLYFSSLWSGKYAGEYDMEYPFGALNTRPSGVFLTIGTIKVTLDAPPTYQCTDPYYNTDFIYAGLTTASVDVSELTAQYGGYITSAELKIGSQTATLTGDATDTLTSGTLSIPLNTAGTFTPAITITDSRGQTSTKTFTAITVGEYVAPSASFSVLRTNASGVQDDEGAYALLTTTVNYTNAVAKLTQPLTTLDGVSESATWYTDRALTNAVDWTNYNPTSPVTLYGIFGGNLSTVQSYTIGLTPTDSDSSGAEITQTLATAFYTIDFLAGGHGIAFGQPASQDGFECNMPTTFHDTVTMEDAVSVMDANSTLRALFDFIHPVGSYYETSDASFNPNTTWGGTWVLETEGQVHVSAGTNYIVGSIGGEATHTLTIDEMPSHSHNYAKASGSGVQGASGASYWVLGNPIDASLSTSTTGSGQAHNNMQPYIVVNRWHRTA